MIHLEKPPLMDKTFPKQHLGVALMAGQHQICCAVVPFDLPIGVKLLRFINNKHYVGMRFADSISARASTMRILNQAEIRAEIKFDRLTHVLKHTIYG